MKWWKRRPRGTAAGGQFARRARQSATLALAADEMTSTQRELADIVAHAELDGAFAIAGDDDNHVRIVGAGDGRTYELVATTRLNVLTFDMAGRMHAFEDARSFGGPHRNAETVTTLVERAREAAIAAESVDAAVAASGRRGTSFAGAGFVFDHFMYGDSWALLVDGDDGRYWIGRGYDEATEQVTDVGVYRSPGIARPASPQVAVDILTRATGIADADAAIRYAEQVGAVAMDNFRRLTGR